ncbi:hypothetical protein F2Q69_00021276 [Brassica cretica]|uniref:Uncharacterized protein n=1 Tax=Brassica cretica TaxID=69181 RepID=A0A8S9QK71_BRACR|nr:hypothetical protein F2Q69_00021276 [Brassica cretica]
MLFSQFKVREFCDNLVERVVKALKDTSKIQKKSTTTRAPVAEPSLFISEKFKELIENLMTCDDNCELPFSESDLVILRKIHLTTHIKEHFLAPGDPCTCLLCSDFEKDRHVLKMFNIILCLDTLQENSGILTDIPTENEILGISRGISEEILRKHKIGFPRNFLGIYRRNSEEISIRPNIPRKFRGKMCSSEKTDEFRGNIIAVGEPLGDFTKFRGNSDELAFSVGIPSEFPRDIFLGIYRGTPFLGIYRGTGSSEYTEGHVPRNIPRKISLGIFRSINGYMSKNASIDELPRKYPDEVLPRDFRGKKKFRGIISEDLFRRDTILVCNAYFDIDGRARIHLGREESKDGCIFSLMALLVGTACPEGCTDVLASVFDLLMDFSLRYITKEGFSSCLKPCLTPVHILVKRIIQKFSSFVWNVRQVCGSSRVRPYPSHHVPARPE